jgi:DNA repair exonuclease SbcCD nuclease subunit
MRFRFIHAADIHLGYEQYNLPARADDFARAHFGMVEHAVSVGADFVLIAGDLFHRANADAWTLKQATHGLNLLRQAKIPVVAIEGNHDAQHYRKNLSWLEYLCDQDLLYLLNVQTTNGIRSLVPFDLETRRGSWIDLAGARIYGIKYYGAMSARVLEELYEELEPGPGGYTILMLHAGLEGQVPHLHGGLTHAQIAPLHKTIDYLALGHIHKRLLVEYDWVFNPGSTETNSMEELDWPHGFFDVEVDTEANPIHQVTVVETPNLRPFRRISVGAEESASLDDFVARVEEHVSTQQSIPEKAVVELYLAGVAQFRRQDVPVERLKAAVELRFAPLIVRVRNNLVPPGVVSVRSHEGMTRLELERQVIEQLVYQQGEYRDSAAAWARLIVEVKNMAAEKDLPASIVDRVRLTLSKMAAPGEAHSPDAVPAAPAEEPLAAGSEVHGSETEG